MTSKSLFFRVSHHVAAYEWRPIRAISAHRIIHHRSDEAEKEKVDLLTYALYTY